MNEKLPQALQADINHPRTAVPPDWCKGSVQSVLLCELEDDGGCRNCNGHGYLVAFYSCVGPHKNAASSLKVTSTWIGDAKTGAWYYGEHRCFPCPECNPVENQWYNVQSGKSEYSG